MKTKTQIVGIILNAGINESAKEPRMVIGLSVEDLQSLTPNPLFKLCRIEILDGQSVKAEERDGD